jgi:hypothetical protein
VEPIDNANSEWCSEQWETMQTMRDDAWTQTEAGLHLKKREVAAFTEGRNRRLRFLKHEHFNCADHSAGVIACVSVRYSSSTLCQYKYLDALAHALQV